MKNSYDLPDGWVNLAHRLWLDEKRADAIQETLKRLNQQGEKKSKEIFSQLSYYLYLIKDYRSACVILQQGLSYFPTDTKMLVNIASSFSRCAEYEKAISFSNKVTSLDPTNFVAWDILAKSYSRSGEFSLAAKAGTTSLSLKDNKFGKKTLTFNLLQEPVSHYSQNKIKVISFSLWGNNRRYLCGALRNLLLARDIYPGWELWFYIDNSVPEDFVKVILELGGKVHTQANNQTLKQKLCWRFKVANASGVGYFIIRDSDSVINVREFNAVQQWIESGKCFHIIRDWWTHTDLILAGLWGGIAGLLPDIDKMLALYHPEKMATPNIDQWFLRDKLWPYIKASCLVHDRCFTHHNSAPLPGAIPWRDKHIGQCEFSADYQYQTQFLAPWIKQKELHYLLEKN